MGSHEAVLRGESGEDGAGGAAVAGGEPEGEGGEEVTSGCGEDARVGGVVGATSAGREEDRRRGGERRIGYGEGVERGGAGRAGGHGV